MATIAAKAPGSESNDELQLAIDVFGPDLVAYMLGLATDQLEDAETLPPSSAAALDLLAEFLAEYAANAANDAERGRMRVSVLGPRNNDTSVGFASALRLQSVPYTIAANQSDKLEVLLATYLRDVFPVLLLSEIENHLHEIYLWLPSCAKFSYGDELATTIRTDPNLSKLFSNGIPHDETGTATIVWLSGSGGTLTTSGIADSIIRNTLFVAYVKGVRTFDGSLTILRSFLMVSRSLADGHPTSVPAVVVVSHVALGEGVHDVDLGRSQLFSYRPTPIDTILDWRSRQGLALMVTETDEAILERRAGLEGSDWMSAVFERNGRRMDAARLSLRDTLDRARLALLLASEEDLIAPIPLAATSVNPLDPVGWSAEIFDAPTQRLAAPATIAAPNAERANYWSGLLNRRNIQALNIGVRRLLSAVAMRTDPVDSFIDGVLCWENLFGDPQESTFKVCGALAMLIEPTNAEKRKTAYLHLKRLYTVRSNVVHGSKELNRAEAMAHRKDAIEYAISAMRIALEDPGLLALSDSGKRYLYVLMQFSG